MQVKSKIWEKLGRHEHIWYDRVPIFSDSKYNWSVSNALALHNAMYACNKLSLTLQNLTFDQYLSYSSNAVTNSAMSHWKIPTLKEWIRNPFIKKEKASFCTIARNLETLVVIQQLLKLSLESWVPSAVRKQHLVVGYCRCQSAGLRLKKA